MRTRDEDESAQSPHSQSPRPDSPLEAAETLTAEELRQRLRSLEAILDAAPVSIAIAHDPDCHYISANRALASLIGVPGDVNISLTPPGGEEPAYRSARRP